MAQQNRKGKDKPMRTRLLLLVPAALLIASPILAATPGDSAAIRQATLDYIEGFYEGSAERMTRAVHPDLAKRVVKYDSTGNGEIQHMTAEELIGITEKGYGKQIPKERQQKDVEILHIYENSACVFITAGDWIDYLHLARFPERWMIVNVLWEPKPRK